MNTSIYFLVTCFVGLEVGATSFLTDSQFNDAMHYLENHNELEIKAVMLVVNKKHSTDITIETAIQNIVKGEDNARYPRYFSFHVTPENTSVIVNQLRDTSVPTLVVLHGFEFDVDLVNFIAFFPTIALISHCWLIVLMSIFENESSLRKETSLLFPISDRKQYIDIHSLLHIVVDINSTYYLFEFYYKCVNQPVVLQKLICLDDGYDNENLEALNIWERRKDLSGCTFRVGYFNYTPNVREEESGFNLEYPRRVFEMGGKIMYGREVQMFSLLHSILNFSVSWEYILDETFGSYKEETGNWSGIVGMVKRSQIDTSLISLSITGLRREAVEFAHPIRKYEYLLFLKKPKASLHWDTYYAVFDWKLWIIWITFILLCSFLIYFCFYYVHGNSKKSNIVLDTFSALSTPILATMALDTFQASKTNGRFQVTKKTILFTVCVFGMMMYYSYNAILISSLMVQDYVIPIKTLENLLDHPSYKLLIVAGTSAETFLKNHTDEWAQKVWDKVVSEEGNISSLKGVEGKLLYDQYKVLWYSYPDIPMMFESYPCKITADKSTRLLEYGSYAFHQESPYVDLFSYYMSYIVEKGLETEYFDQNEENTFSCEEDNESSFMSINFDGVISAFVLVGVGCLLASACLITERVYSRLYFNISKSNVKPRRPTILRIHKSKISLEYLNVTRTSKFSRFDEI